MTGGDEDVSGVIDRYFKAIEDGDAASIAECYHDDLCVWHNLSDTEMGKAENLRLLGESPVRLRYQVEERMVVGDRVVQRHRLHMTGPNGQTSVMPVAIFFTVRAGKIHRIDEYFDGGRLRTQARDVGRSDPLPE